MLPPESNMTMPSAVVSRIAPSSSALAWPTADGGFSGTGSAMELAGGTAAAAAGDMIRASAGSSSQEIVKRRASVDTAGSDDPSVAAILTGVPASDVLDALEMPAST